MTKTRTAEEIRSSAIDAVVEQLDKERICYCQSYAGEKHDQNPPCNTVKRATAIIDSISHLLVAPGV